MRAYAPTLEGGEFLEFNFAKTQSFGPSKRSPEQKESGLSMFLTDVTSIFLISGPEIA